MPMHCTDILFSCVALKPKEERYVIHRPVKSKRAKRAVLSLNYMQWKTNKGMQRFLHISSVVPYSPGHFGGVLILQVLCSSN